MSQTALGQEDYYYSFSQVKDTLIKYNNPFEAFDNLDLDKIPITEFRKDSFLLKKSYELLDVNKIKEWEVEIAKKKKQKWFKDDLLRKNIIMEYLKKERNISLKECKMFYDSISQNQSLIKNYFELGLSFEIKKDSVKIYELRSLDLIPVKYIFFHSCLMTQTGYDTIRTYYDKYYGNSKSFNNPVTIALINMGDPVICSKYDSLFNEKIKSVFSWDDYIFLSNYIRGSYLYRKLAILLNINDSVCSTDIKEHFSSFHSPFNFPLSDSNKEENDKYSNKFYTILFGDSKDYSVLYPFYDSYSKSLEEEEKQIYKIIYKN